jgi:hypothetical protein
MSNRTLKAWMTVNAMLVLAYLGYLWHAGLQIR